jgi:hypothetical protein
MLRNLKLLILWLCFGIKRGDMNLLEHFKGDIKTLMVQVVTTLRKVDALCEAQTELAKARTAQINIDPQIKKLTSDLKAHVAPLAKVLEEQKPPG